MSPLVMGHMAAALLAVPLGGWLLLGRKGTAVHKAAGRLWVGLMIAAALSSFWITGVNGERWSWIHLLSAWTLVWIGLAVWRIRAGNVAGHLRAMRGVYVGLLVAGAWAALPGRSLGNLLWG
jgi:uncharacterized membrane protein